MGRADDLFDDPPRLLALVVAWGRRDVQQLVGLLPELLEGERAVVVGRRQSKAVLDERILAGLVAGVLPANLRKGDVGFVDDGQEVLGEVIEQGVGASPESRSER